MKFWNSGGLPLALTPELLLTEHYSIPRNRQLAEAFFYMGLIERWGSGTTRIASELQLNGHPLPLFKSESGRFSITFFKTEYDNELLKEKNLTGISKSTAPRELRELVEKNILILEGLKGQGVTYKFKVN